MDSEPYRSNLPWLQSFECKIQAAMEKDQAKEIAQLLNEDSCNINNAMLQDMLSDYFDDQLSRKHEYTYSNVNKALSVLYEFTSYYIYTPSITTRLLTLTYASAIA